MVRPLGRTPVATGLASLCRADRFCRRRRDRARYSTPLRERGIGTQVHYIPVHRQPYYRARYGALRLPGAEAYYARCLSLPLFPAMTDGDVGRVVAALKWATSAA